MQIIARQDQTAVLLEEKLNRFFTESYQDIPQREKRFIRLEVPLHSLEPLSWLMCQENEVKFYWHDREDNFTVAGIGCADQIAGDAESHQAGRVFKRIEENLKNSASRLRYYGGMRFSEKKIADDSWRIFGSYWFVVPQFEIFFSNTAKYFACNFLFDVSGNIDAQREHLFDNLKQLKWDFPGMPVDIPTALGRSDFPDKTGWRNNIATVLNLFHRHQIEKIVLARKSRFEFSDAVNALELLRRLQQADSRAFHFYFQPAARHAFLGGTPERLYSRSKQRIYSEAVAGTRPRGIGKEGDQQLENELTGSEKDLREHRFVRESIRKSFQRVCSEIYEQENVSVLKLAKVQHLYAGIKGILKTDVDNGQILTTLHPTPAVGGYPTEAALREIAALEPFDRGWYAGPVGWISKEAAEFAVAIRSALVEECTVCLYAGAGIVPGSSPDKEWEELESKIANFI